MELRINEVQLPAPLTFNYEELKQGVSEKTSMYKTLVYTDTQIKDAKGDRADLNRLKKTLNDERIRLEKEYMESFMPFKKQINEVISIIDEAILAVDAQVKGYEEKQKQDKLASIKDYFESTEIALPMPMTFEQIYNPKWLNASVSMKSIQDEINAKLEQIKNDLVTLSNLPEFSFEATEVYKSTLDLRKALDEAHRLSEMAKKKAEHEAEQARLAAEVEAKVQEEAVVVGTVTAEANVDGQTVPVAEIPVEVPAKQWISFSALLSVEDATALKQFFESRNIEFKAI